MEKWEIILVVLGCLVFVWLLVSLNNFVGGGSITRFIGTGVSFGIFIIIIGIMAWAYLSGEISRELGGRNGG